MVVNSFSPLRTINQISISYKTRYDFEVLTAVFPQNYIILDVTPFRLARRSSI